MPAKAAPRGRWVVAAVFGLFLLPVSLAWLIAGGHLDWLPKGHTNYGMLIMPVIPIAPRLEPADQVRLPRRYGSWTLALMQGGTTCNAGCADGWDRLGRIREALQVDELRVTAAVIRETDATPPDTRAVQLPLPRAAMQELQQALARHDPATMKDRLVIIDYRGNIVMLYPAHADMSGVLKDLKRLLKASKTAS